MARHQEPLDGGLVDGPDPATLKPGQLSSLTNAVYRSNAPALQRARGRVTFGTATATASDINGLRDCQFDLSAGHYLIAQVSGVVPAYVSAFVGDTGTFGILTTAITAGSALDRTQFRNRFYLFNGASSAPSAINTNQVFYLSATAASSLALLRQHGMLPVMSTPLTAASTATFSLTVTGYYEYWTTEMAQITQDGATFEIESSFGGSATGTAAGASVATVNVSSTAMAPVISMPQQVNPISTHWRIYRSPKKDFPTDRKFPIGFQIASPQIISGTATANTFTDTLTTTSVGPVLPTIANTSGPASMWASASSMFTVDSVYASAIKIVGISPTVPMFKYQGVYGFNFGGFHGNIYGVAVELKAYVTDSNFGAIDVAIGKRGPTGDFNGGFYSKSLILTQTPTVYTLGGSADRWAPPDQAGLLDSDFDTNFMVRVFGLAFNRSYGVDYVRATVYYGAAQAGSIVPFPTVIYTFGDIAAQVGKNGPPPSSSTGDLYQDQLVVNDVSIPSLIRYSAPGEPDAFPPTYFIDMETDANDTVQLIKTVNNRVIVCMNTGTYRLNYLPSERDASFDRGKAIEPISEHFGCLNPMCGCVYSMDTIANVGAAQRLAWVSQKGIHSSDGYDFITLTQNLNWRAILGLTGTIYGIALINNPEEQELRFYYSNSALGNEADKCLHLSYASQHTSQEGRLKISGGVNMRNWNIAASASGALKSAWSVPRSNGDTSIYLGYGSATAASGGMVMREAASAIPALDPNFRFVTRRMYLAGEGDEFEANEVYAYLGSNTGTAGIDMTMLTVKTNDDAGEVTKSTKSVAFAGRKHGKYQFRQIAEGLRISANASGNPNNDISMEHLIIDGTDFGVEDSGK